MGRALLLILAAIILFASCYNPKNYDDESDFIVVVNGKTIEITGYKGTNTELNIPPRIKKLPVTVIGKKAFYSYGRESRAYFTSVKISKGVTHIGEEAFHWNAIKEITIPNTVIFIGDGAFSHNKLTNVIIPNSVTHIGNSAFSSNQIEHIIIPDNITKIGNGAFAFNRITEVVLPSRITEIGSWLFKDNNISSITIPEKVVTIGDNAFENNRLTELIIPKSVTSIGRWAFSRSNHAMGWYDDRNHITKITIGDNVECDNAFMGFSLFYDFSVRKRGGTYIYVDHHWRPEDKNIPVYRFYPDKGWNSSDINFLLDMPDLESVIFRDNNVLTDITPLSELKNIRTMTIQNCLNIDSIKPLSSLTNMESLYITHNDNYHYQDIASLQKLDHLTITEDHADEIDLGSMGQMRYLKSLVLRAGTIKNINALQNLANLEKLEISSVLDLSWISNLHNLTELEVYSGIIDDISPLAALPNLAHVDLTHLNTIKDIKPLLHSNSLKYVRVPEHNVEGGIDANTRLMFRQKNIYLDTFYDTR